MEELTATVPLRGIIHSETSANPDIGGDNNGSAADLDIPLDQSVNKNSSDCDGINRCQADSSNLLCEKESKENVTTEKCQDERRVGYASIKKEFLIENYKPKLHTEYLNPEMRKMMESSKKESNKEVDTVDEGDNTVTKHEATEIGDAEPPAKKSKLKGRNKHRPRNERISEKDKLCPAIKGNRECRYGEKCKFSHDKDEFMKKKLPELDGPCHNFDTFGYCHFGLTCRFAKNHISPDLQNVVNSELFDEAKVKKTLNDLNGDVRNKLWKKKYNFSKADKAVKEVQKFFRGWHVEDTEKPAIVDCKQSNADYIENLATSVPEISSQNPISVEGLNCVASDSTGQPSVTENSPSDEKLTIENVSEIRSLGTITDEELISLRPQEKVKIDFRNKLYLAPLTTVGNLPFRRVCKGFGAEITCGEMALVPPLLKARQSEWSLIKRHPCEDIFGVQICGSYPDLMTRCTQLLTETCNVDFIDINCGCPIDMVYKKGGGSALMGKATKLEQICRSMLGVMGDKPLTVKVRTGVFDDKNVAHTLIPRLRDAGVSMVTIHGRSREQRYTKSADWKYIGQCASLGAPMPVFGNGDILSYEDANAYREQSGVSGVMIARGALIKPWIFTEIKEQRHWDISSGERFDILKTYTNYGLEHWGSDHQGVENTRRFLLEWLSFLHRYIPVGVLEQPPQRINERPPYYIGRNDLETLMASANCADWIKISEMLLGPVPPTFRFLPKHKANAYQ